MSAAPYDGDDLDEMEAAIYSGRGVSPAAALRHIARSRRALAQVEAIRETHHRWGMDPNPEANDLGYWREIDSALSAERSVS